MFLQNQTNSNNYKASLWMMLAALTMSVSIFITKILVKKYNSSYIFCCKTLLTILLLAPVFFFHSKGNICKIFKLPKLYYIRALLTTVNYMIWYSCIKHISMVDAVSITYLTPILNLAAGLWIFKEKISLKKACGIILAFTGVYCILRPGFREFSLWLYLTVIVAIFWSVIDIICKIQVQNESIINLMFYNALLVIIFSSPYLYSRRESIEVLSTSDFCILFISAIIQLLNIYAFFKAYKYGELTVIIPVDFMKLVFSTLISHFILNSPIKIIDICGVLILIISSLTFLSKEKASKLKNN